jgi:hypothetical protein
MYDNSTPIGGQISSTRGNLTRVTKSNPCPHCGKPDWCYFIGELSVCNRDQPPATGWEATSKTDKDDKTYYARPQEKKSVRPAQTRYWEYPDRDGSPLIRVRRIDFGDGVTKKDIKQQHWDKNKKEWVMGYGGVPRDNIPIYRYAEVREAIANGKQIFLVDGEQCADILWEFNLAATTSIGGMGKVSLTTFRDLQGAQVVIVPDRDEPGLKDANKAAEYFPDARWLYPFPGKDWERLPKSDGLDIFDWIGQGNLSPSKIRAAIGEKKVFNAPPAPASSKLISHPTWFDGCDLSELKSEIEKLGEQNLKGSNLSIAIASLAQKYRRQTQEVRALYQEIEQEADREANRGDMEAEVTRLLNSNKYQINLSEIIPSDLAAPIEKLAALLNLRPECYLGALLTQISGLFKVGTIATLRRDSDFFVTPNYFLGIVAESSQKKTPIGQAICDRPMRPLREKARKEFEKAQLAYEAELATYKADKSPDKGAAPKPPRLKLYSFAKSTGEGILYQVQEYPDQALMYRCDELAGLFKSANQYRGGKGSDEEDLLEFWNGTGSTVLRATGTKVDLEGLLLSVFGTIQPDVLATFLKDCSDSNGKFARFDFIVQPLAPSRPPLDDGGKLDLTPMLADIYQKIDALPPLNFELDTEAKQHFTRFLWGAEEQRCADTIQGKRAMLGKMPTKVGKLAIIIHTLNCVFHDRPVTTNIPKSAVEAAIKFATFTASQTDLLYTEFADRTALAPNLAKILALAERKGGAISVRDVTLTFDSKHRPTKEQIQSWFTELAEMKYGETTTKNQRILFTSSPHSTVSTVTPNPDTVNDYLIHTSPSTLSTVSTLENVNYGKNVDKCGYNVDNPIHTSKPLQSMGLEQSVDTVDTFFVTSKNSKSENAQRTTTRKPRILEIGDRVVVKDVGGRYQGVRGVITEIRPHSTHTGLMVKFDKEVAFSRQCEFIAGDLMYLAPGL